MKRFAWIGLLMGAIHSGFTWYSMITPMPYAVWDAVNSALFIAALGVLLAMVIRSVGKDWSIMRVVAGAALFSIGYLSVQLAAYVITTRFFADRLVQLPFFFRDYTYHAYVFPVEYLSTGSNYADLLGLQVFSMGVVLIFQVALAGLVGVAAQRLIKRDQQAPITE